MLFKVLKHFASVSICIQRLKNLIDSQFLEHLNRCLLHCIVIHAAIQIRFSFCLASPNIDKGKNEKRKREKRKKKPKQKTWKVFQMPFNHSMCMHINFSFALTICISYYMICNWIYAIFAWMQIWGAAVYTTCDCRAKCITCQCVNCIHIWKCKIT